MDMQLRAKKIAIKTVVVLCEEDMEAGMLEQRYGDLKAKGGPSVGGALVFTTRWRAWTLLQRSG